MADGLEGGRLCCREYFVRVIYPIVDITIFDACVFCALLVLVCGLDQGQPAILIKLERQPTVPRVINLAWHAMSVEEEDKRTLRRIRCSPTEVCMDRTRSEYFHGSCSKAQLKDISSLVSLTALQNRGLT